MLKLHQESLLEQLRDPKNNLSGQTIMIFMELVGSYVRRFTPNLMSEEQVAELRREIGEFSFEGIPMEIIRDAVGRGRIIGKVDVDGFRGGLPPFTVNRGQPIVYEILKRRGGIHRAYLDDTMAHRRSTEPLVWVLIPSEQVVVSSDVVGWREAQ